MATAESWLFPGVWSCLRAVQLRATQQSWPQEAEMDTALRVSSAPSSSQVIIRARPPVTPLRHFPQPVSLFRSPYRLLRMTEAPPPPPDTAADLFNYSINKYGQYCHTPHCVPTMVIVMTLRPGRQGIRQEETKDSCCMSGALVR